MKKPIEVFIRHCYYSKLQELEYYFSTEVVPKGYIKVLEKVGYDEIGKMTLDEIAQMGSELLNQNEE